jgi:hypothetical protein
LEKFVGKGICTYFLVDLGGQQYLMEEVCCPESERCSDPNQCEPRTLDPNGLEKAAKFQFILEWICVCTPKMRPHGKVGKFPVV